MHHRQALYDFNYELVVGWCRHSTLPFASSLLSQFSVSSHAFLILFPTLILEHDSKMDDGTVFFFL